MVPLLVTLVLATAPVLALATASASEAQEKDKYEELLELRPLPDARTVATLGFQTVSSSISLSPHSSSSSSDGTHFDLFPKTLGQIVMNSGVREFNLAITKGIWDYDAYGPLASNLSGPPGAELRANFGDKENNSENLGWARLKEALSGIFCASLSTIEDATTLGKLSTNYVFAGETVGFLWREMLCTENLVPIVKLLPCRDHAGLSAYLRPLITAQADFMSVSVHVRQIPHHRKMKGQMAHSLEMDINVVLVLPSSSDTDGMAHATFDIAQDLLGERPYAKLPRACPVAASSKIRVSSPIWGSLSTSEATPSNESVAESPGIIHVSRRPDRVLKRPQNSAGGSSFFWEYDSLPEGHLPLSFTFSPSARRSELLWQNSLTSGYASEGLDVRRSLIGTGRYSGGLRTVIKALDSHDHMLKVYYLDVIPWYLRTFSHLLRVELAGDVIVNGAWRSDTLEAHKALKDHRFVPSRARSTPGLFEASIELEPGQELVIEHHFELSFLQFEEFPPDANRGFDIPGVILKVAKEGGPRIYTSNLMIEMPYPDFSMPYNVITLTSTVLAFAAGTLLNLLGRKRKRKINVEQNQSAPDAEPPEMCGTNSESTTPRKSLTKAAIRRQRRTLMPPMLIDAGSQSLGFEVSIHSLPQMVLSEVQQVLPSVEGEIIAVLTAQKSKYGLVEWGDDVAKEKDELLERFVEWCNKVVSKLKTAGHWADYIDPCSGLPANSDGNKIYGEVDGFQVLLGYKTQNANCCKILLHPAWGAAVYPASLFTNAPADVVMKVVLECSGSIPKNSEL